MPMGFPPFPPFRSGIPHWSERVVTYCAKVLPVVFDNSLSYYEFLGHIQLKLNEVIKALNSQNLVFVEFTHMIELELQNFEAYMEERQTNFEEQMQQEWEIFKTELRAEWAAFKEGLRAEWEAEKELNEQFRTDMQEAFENFQTLIATQQQQFETLITNQQNQFQADMTSRQNNFESTMEDEFEQWKVDTLAALQQGIQQFEQDALAAIRAELPEIVEEVVTEDVLRPIIADEVGHQEFAKITKIENATAGNAVNLANYDIALFDGDTLIDDELTLADLSNVTIKPNTSIVILSDASDANELYAIANSVRVMVGDSSFPASGYTVSIGLYNTDDSTIPEFASENYVERTHAAAEDTTSWVSATLGKPYWEGDFRSNHFITVRFLADDSEPSFTCDYSAGIEAYYPPEADVTFQDSKTGNKVIIPKPSVVTVDQVYVAASANPQSGTAVADALSTIQVDQSYTPASTNAQSGTALKQAMDTVPDTIKNSVQAQRFVSLAAVENQTMGGQMNIANFPVQVFEGSTLVDTTTFSQLTNLTIKPNTTLIFPYSSNTIGNLYWLANSVNVAFQKTDFPASGYTMSAGYYTLSDHSFNSFDETYYRQLDSHAVTNGAASYLVVGLTPVPWYAHRQEIYSLAIRFLADSSEPSFTCDFTDGLFAFAPHSADLTLQDGMTGIKFSVPKQQAITVDQTYNASSTNAQSGTAVAQAIASVPTVTVDQTYASGSTNAQSGTAVAQAIASGITYQSDFNLTITLNKITSNSGDNIYSTVSYALGSSITSSIPKGIYLVYSDNGFYCYKIIIRGSTNNKYIIVPTFSILATSTAATSTIASITTSSLLLRIGDYNGT